MFSFFFICFTITPSSHAPLEMRRGEREGKKMERRECNRTRHEQENSLAQEVVIKQGPRCPPRGEVKKPGGPPLLPSSVDYYKTRSRLE